MEPPANPGRFKEQDDRTLDEIVAAMRKHRIPGSRTALFRFLERHGITHKNVWPAPSARVISQGVLVCIHVSGHRA